ncbi:hypothetical protein BB560_004825 [Smittium megazygosporum]|uniref:Uncharacterized protein n=1 Tax=Smittium megazygosporum TaxID=133381 RepID=A0A2T9Z851_9FUNG|nr:hypothetical protein BB560_004825 [Smittium megazygosporum]
MTELQSQFILMGSTLNQFGLPNVSLIDSFELNLHRMELEGEIEEGRRFVAENAQLLLPEQKDFFETVCSAILNERSDIFFFDAAVGRATLYRNGFTTHTIFGIPIEESRSDTPVSTISANSQRAELIRSSRICEETSSSSSLRSPHRFANNLEFSYFLDSIGNGSIVVNNEVDSPGLNLFYGVEDAIEYCFPDVNDTNSCSYASIFCGTNSEADLINKVVPNMLPAESKRLLVRVSSTGKEFTIPWITFRIKLLSRYTEIKRRQFPLRLANATTID